MQGLRGFRFMTEMAPSEAPIAVTVVEDHPGLRQELVSLLGAAEGIVTAGAFESAEEALVAMAQQRPDVVLVDLELPGASGTDFVRVCRARYPDVECIILTVHDEAAWVFPALAAGASGYLLKGTRPERLLQAIRQVHDGGSEMSSNVARMVLKSLRSPMAPGVERPGGGLSRLTPRELEVLEALSRGCSYEEIGTELGCQVRTVNTHLHNIYGKLHVRSAAGAVGKYLRGR